MVLLEALHDIHHVSRSDVAVGVRNVGSLPVGGGVISDVHRGSRPVDDVLVRQVSKPIVSITLPLPRPVRRRQTIQGVVGVGDLLAGNHVGLRRDLAVVLGGRVRVLDVQRRAHFRTWHPGAAPGQGLHHEYSLEREAA